MQIESSVYLEKELQFKYMGDSLQQRILGTVIAPCRMHLFGGMKSTHILLRTSTRSEIFKCACRWTDLQHSLKSTFNLKKKQNKKLLEVNSVLNHHVTSTFFSKQHDFFFSFLSLFLFPKGISVIFYSSMFLRLLYNVQRALAWNLRPYFSPDFQYDLEQVTYIYIYIYVINLSKVTFWRSGLRISSLPFLGL